LTLKAAGRVSDNLNKTAKVASTLEGRLIKLNFDLNDRIKIGDVLGLVQTPELLGKPLELKAPIDGVITERKSTVGELVGKETEIYTISDPADLWVIAEIKERDIGAVKVGQDASFTVLAYPDEEFHGKVVRIGNRVEAESRTMEVRIEVTNTNGRLKPGMFADVEIVTTIWQDALLMPDTALQTDGGDQIVFVALDSSRFEKRVVKTGMEQRGRVAVLEGVKQGENVVTEGSFILKSEMLKGELGEE
jgi:RND family efflux transporter MFP subunit